MGIALRSIGDGLGTLKARVPADPARRLRRFPAGARLTADTRLPTGARLPAGARLAAHTRLATSARFPAHPLLSMGPRLLHRLRGLPCLLAEAPRTPCNVAKFLG